MLSNHLYVGALFDCHRLPQSQSPLSKAAGDTEKMWGFLVFSPQYPTFKEPPSLGFAQPAQSTNPWTKTNPHHNNVGVQSSKIADFACILIKDISYGN